MIIRDHLVMNFGSQSAGYWEAMSRLSGAYLMLFTSILGVYYLPKYAGLRSGAALRQEILNGYKIILPVVSICCFAIYLLRDFIIATLFTREFLPMRDLFFWYQIGDILKIGSWLLAFLMLGKTMLKSFMITEVVFTASYVLLTYLFTSRYGLIGTALSYAVNYLLYWLTLYLIMRNGILSDTHAEPLAGGRGEL
jgi:PST family polysaccharide transporter